MHTTRETFNTAPSVHLNLHRVSLDHTASAALIGEGSDNHDPTPREIEHYRMGWWWGLTCGGCAVALVMGLAVAAFVFGLKA